MGRAGEAAQAARSNRYVKQMIEDEQLRANLVAAWAAAREAYGRMGNGKPATKAIFDDRKVQRSLMEAASHLREASQSLTQPPPKPKRKGGIGRALLLIVVAGVLAVALSEELRSKVLDLLFGAEEEFDYSSTTTPPEPAPSASASESEAEAPAS